MKQIVFDNPSVFRMEIRDTTIAMRVEQDKESLSMYSTRDEVAFYLKEKTINPWFDDLSKLILLGHDGIYTVPSYASSSEEKTFVPIRSRELRPVLIWALEQEAGVERDLLDLYRDSKRLAVPSVVKEFSLGVDLLLENNTSIAPWMERLSKIAEGYSSGQDDPATLYVSKENEKNLYFEIHNNGRRRLNGGVIWHESAQGYGIHT